MKIIFKNVSKKYENREIFSEVNECFCSGDSVALTGHNGCGKSTLLKIIAGICTSTGGVVAFEGVNEPSFAYVPEKFPAFNITAMEYLKSVCEINKMEKQQAVTKIEELSDDFNCREHLNKRMTNLSKGTLQKIGVIQALLQNPDILLLDEPLSGQDRDSQRVFIEKINEFREQGKIVVMSCHEMELVKAISNRVFEYKNRRIVPVKNIEEKDYTIYFLNAAGASLWPNMKVWGEGYKIVCRQGEIEEKVRLLIDDGFFLRGIYEND